MYFRSWCSLLSVFLFLTIQPVKGSNILFADVNSGDIYTDHGLAIADILSNVPGATVTTRNLNEGVWNDYGTFDQIWVYDLSVLPDRNSSQLTNYSRIADWYNTRANRNIILDARILLSVIPLGSPALFESTMLQHWATVLEQYGGGLFLGTDHEPYAVEGVNDILTNIGMSGFQGLSGSVVGAVVDQSSSLWTSGISPHCPDDSCINDGGSPGIAPVGLQANGQELLYFARHDTDLTQAAVSYVLVAEPYTILVLIMGLGLCMHQSARRLWGPFSD